MMTLKNIALLGGLGLAAASLTPATASAAFDGWTTRTLYEHAGPGNQYPTVGVVPGGVRVTIFGCLRGITYCDIDWRGNRGWVRASGLTGMYHNKRVPLVRFGVQLGIPFIGFSFGYWDDHYHNKPFFKQRHKWDKNWPMNGDFKKEGDYKKPMGQKPTDDSEMIGAPKKEGPAMTGPKKEFPDTGGKKDESGMGGPTKNMGSGPGGKDNRPCKPGEQGDDCRPQ